MAEWMQYAIGFFVLGWAVYFTVRHVLKEMTQPHSDRKCADCIKKDILQKR
jgi:hypothetical protein